MRKFWSIFCLYNKRRMRNFVCLLFVLNFLLILIDSDTVSTAIKATFYALTTVKPDFSILVLNSKEICIHFQVYKHLNIKKVERKIANKKSLLNFGNLSSFWWELNCQFVCLFTNLVPYNFDLRSSHKIIKTESNNFEWIFSLIAA